MTLAIEFHGAARYTTGSKHLIDVGGQRILLDCGLVQGPRRIAEEANRRFAFDPRGLHCVVLSHAHIDHAGALPRLVKDGFRGAIWCTRATLDLAEVILLDSAKIQESDARYLNKQRPHGQPRVEPLYDTRDVERCIKAMVGIDYHEPREIAPGVRVLLRDAGHILGSASVELQIRRPGGEVRIGFTGDHGRRGMPILKDPERFESLDYLLTESTYGNRRHEQLADLDVQLAELIHEENQDGGRVLIPAFAVGRTQNLVYELGKLRAEGRIPRIPIYVDSPMASATTRIVAAHPECYDAEVRQQLAEGRNPFYYEGIRYIDSVEESKELNTIRNPHIVIAASGMCESGRVLHHLAHSAGRKEDCLLIVGFQAEGTLGRRLLEGARQARIYDATFDVRMKVRKMNGLSAHADWGELLDHLGHLAASVKTAFVVHGEEPQASAMREHLLQAGFRDVRVPHKRERVTL
jgi:metallo-beta-lactamase family protein